MTDYRPAGYVGDASERENRALNAILNAQGNTLGRLMQVPHADLSRLGYGKPEQVRALLDRLVEQGKAEEGANGKYKRIA
jgi:hypothetical protein